MLAAPPLRIRNLVKEYGSLRAVDDVSLEIRAGEIFGLLGPNGAGKTSIISTLVALEQPTSGTVEIFGYDVVKRPLDAKSLVGFVPQEIINHGYFSVEEILRFHSGYFGRLRNRPRIDFLLNRLGLYEHRKKKVKQLSGGMKRRLLIAKALVNEPRLLLLDEPTAGVDIELRRSLWEFVEELKREGITILLTTHYLEEAERLCDRVGIMRGGQVKRLGDTGELVKNLTKREISIVLRGGPESEALRHPLLLRAQAQPETGLRELVFQTPATMSVGELLADLAIEMREVRDIAIREGNLEDALRSVLSECPDEASAAEAAGTSKNQAPEAKR
jgi:ABC-2 type transport system ATP-binding protein